MPKPSLSEGIRELGNDLLRIADDQERLRKWLCRIGEATIRTNYSGEDPALLSGKIRQATLAALRGDPAPEGTGL